MDGSGEDQIWARWSDEVRVKSHKYSELDIAIALVDVKQ